MSNEMKPIMKATKELGSLDREDAYLAVSKLVDESGLSRKDVAECIGKTYRMLHLALSCDKYPGILVDVLKCLGYEAELVQYIETTIKTPQT